MPKIKTSRCAAKRIKFTKSGKAKYKHSNLRHLLSSKSRGRKRHLCAPGVMNKTDSATMRRLLPYL